MAEVREGSTTGRKHPGNAEKKNCNARERNIDRDRERER